MSIINYGLCTLRRYIYEDQNGVKYMQTKFLILIALVFFITAGFCVLIWQQTIRFEKKALAAKQRQKDYERELRQKLHEERKATMNANPEES